MSTIYDSAKIEGECAEAELDEAETGRAKELHRAGATVEDAVLQVLADRDEPEPEPPAAADEPADIGEPTEAQLDQLGATMERYQGDVRRIMGPFVEGFEPCGKCGGAALCPPEPEPLGNPNFIECDTCNGFGQVLTGSRNPQYAFRDCPDCKGRGYLEALDANGQPIAGDGQVQLVQVPDLTELMGNGEAPNAGAAQPTPAFGTPPWMGNTNIGS